MRNFIIIVLFCLCFTNKNYSSECDQGKNCGELQLDSCHKYICYEFGLSNLIDIYIAEGDTICDVLIFDGKGTCVSTTCQKSPILKWAFDVMANEITKSPIIVDNNYKPYYYKLSILYDSRREIISSSALLIDNSDDVKKKIEELKAFIIKLWISNCIKRNSRVPLNDTDHSLPWMYKILAKEIDANVSLAHASRPDNEMDL